MSDRETEEERSLLVDASAYIRLAAVGAADLLPALSGDVIVPDAVAAEIADPPASEVLSSALEDGRLARTSPGEQRLAKAARHLGRATESPDPVTGDVALLASALEVEDAVVVSDDQEVRKTCRALSIPLSGSIGVLIRSVETGVIAPETARDHLHAMDEVGARLSASLVREAERLIDEAAED